jgi:hypothetical protein
MTWMAGRLARAQLAAALAACVALAAVILAADRADSTVRLWLSVLVVTVPGILGGFWGAPLVAGELESGSFRLAWTQDVSRIRWLTVRLAVSGLACVAVAGLLSLAVTWWAEPLDRAALDQFGSFDSRGIAPAGYAAFAFTLGALLGALTRRTVPAMALTLFAFTAVRLAFRLLARPRLLLPLTKVLALNPATTGYGSAGFWPFIPAPSLRPAPPGMPDAWVTSVAVVNQAGDVLTGGALGRACPGIGDRAAGGGGGPGHVRAPRGAADAMHACVARIAAGYHEVITYQPASRYWPLQWFELCVFLAAALLLAGVCAWRVLRIG